MTSQETQNTYEKVSVTRPSSSSQVSTERLLLADTFQPPDYCKIQSGNCLCSRIRSFNSCFDVFLMSLRNIMYCLKRGSLNRCHRSLFTPQCLGQVVHKLCIFCKIRSPQQKECKYSGVRKSDLKSKGKREWTTIDFLSTLLTSCHSGKCDWLRFNLSHQVALLQLPQRCFSHRI